MNVYLWANEIDPQTLGSLNLSGIYKGSDTVWTPAPSTIRLYLLSETDWQPSWDWMWTDDSYWVITYLDLPVDANWVRKWNDATFIAQYNDWVNFVTFNYMLNSSPGSLVNFDRIEYRDSSDNLIWIFDLSQSWWGQQILPLDETWMGIQNNDRMVMVFETQTAPTFTVVNNPSNWNMNNAISASVRSGEGLSSFDINCSANKILLWSDWYYYYAALGVVSYRPQDSRNCYVKMSTSWEEWAPTYTVEDYYIETGTPDNSSFCNYFNQGDSTYIPAIAGYVWDPSIVDVQSLWEYIYNKLQ